MKIEINNKNLLRETDLEVLEKIEKDNLEYLFVFDSVVWKEQGYDKGNNEDCWREAKILKIHQGKLKKCGGVVLDYSNQLFVDVEFDNRISNNHFLTMVEFEKRKLKEK